MSPSLIASLVLSLLLLFSIFLLANDYGIFEPLSEKHKKQQRQYFYVIAFLYLFNVYCISRYVVKKFNCEILGTTIATFAVSALVFSCFYVLCSVRRVKKPEYSLS